MHNVDQIINEAARRAEQRDMAQTTIGDDMERLSHLLGEYQRLKAESDRFGFPWTLGGKS